MTPEEINAKLSVIEKQILELLIQIKSLRMDIVEGLDKSSFDDVK